MDSKAEGNAPVKAERVETMVRGVTLPHCSITLVWQAATITATVQVAAEVTADSQLLVATWVVNQSTTSPIMGKLLSVI